MENVKFHKLAIGVSGSRGRINKKKISCQYVIKLY